MIAGGQAQLNRLINLSTGTVSTIDVTTPIVENTAFGTCTCDRTLNSCDVYCCCDTDCSSNILDFWKSNYATYCTRSYIGSEYRPFSQCIDTTHIYSYNQRLGMEVSIQNGQLCVELDTGSIFSGYAQYIPQFNMSLNQVTQGLEKTLHSK